MVEPHQLVAARLAGARGLGEAADFARQLPHALALRVADHRDHQPARGLRRHAEVHRAVAGEHHRVVVEGGVEHRPVGQRLAHRGDEEGQQGQLGIVAAVAVHHRPRVFEVGDVELLDQGEMRDAALRLLHILGDLAAEADDLDGFVGALAPRRGATLPPL